MPRLIPDFRAARPTGARRPGFTLVELLVALVLLSIVGAALLGTLSKQQRFYNQAGEAMDARSQLRQAASLIPADFRAVSTVGRDLISIDESGVRLLATFGSAVICDRPVLAATSTFDIPPLDGVRNTYTSWSTPPTVGDSVMILDEGALRGEEDDRWLRFGIADVTTSTLYCPASVFITAAEAARSRYRIRVSLPGNAVNAAGVSSPVAAIPTTVVSPGAVVRFARAVDYSLFRSATDSKWYLGLSEYRNGAWVARQVIAGPFTDGGGSDHGVSFRFYNQAGAAVSNADRATVARIDMVLRSAGDTKTQFSSASNGKFSDSLSVRVAIRNRE